MPYPESDLLPLSALQHLLFCERQCALIHVERVWAENRFTAEGRILHKKAHDGRPETRGGVRITRGLPLRSYEMGLSGKADVVLFEGKKQSGWTVTPVEYKRGKPKSNDCDRVQLCAQGLCLEEMLGVEIGRGQLFYGQKRRRFDVEFDDALRETTRRAAGQLHEIVAAGITPPAVREKKCDTCSLLEMCMPAVLGPRKSARRHFERELARAMAED